MTTTLTTTSDLGAALDAAFPEEVSKLPMTGPEGLRTPHYGLFLDGGDCVGVAVRKGYEPHTRDDVKAMSEVAHEAFDGVPVTISTDFRDGHYVSISPTDAYRRSIINSKDSIWPAFNLKAGYDGSAFDAGLWYNRDACSNLAEIRGTDRKARRKIRHTIGLRGKMDELLVTFRSIIHEWEELCEVAETMERREMSTANFMRSMFPNIERDEGAARTIAENRISAIINRIAKEREYLGHRGFGAKALEVATAWELYNGVQGYCQHDKGRRSKRSDYGKALAAAADADVKKALTLALAS